MQFIPTNDPRRTRRKFLAIWQEDGNPRSSTYRYSPPAGERDKRDKVDTFLKLSDEGEWQIAELPNFEGVKYYIVEPRTYTQEELLLAIGQGMIIRNSFSDRFQLRDKHGDTRLWSLTESTCCLELSSLAVLDNLYIDEDQIISSHMPAFANVIEAVGADLNHVDPFPSEKSLSKHTVANVMTEN